MATIRTLRKACPNCNHTLNRGPLTLGPGVVQCKKCGNNIKTGLRNWLRLSTEGKFWEVVSEMLAPSFLADESGIGRFLLNVLVGFLTGMPLVLAMGEAVRSPGEIVGLLVFIPVGLWYPVFLVWRILRLRNQSIRFNQDGEIFKW